MEEKRYKLRFLPLFEDDLNRAIDYIAFELENPEAAEPVGRQCAGCHTGEAALCRSL